MFPMIDPDNASVDFDALARTLAALGYPLRLELIRQLRVPHTLRDLKVAPVRGARTTRTSTAARQTVSGHLDRLVEAGLVRSSPGSGSTPSRYAVDPQRLYRFTEDVRRLATIYANRGAPGDATETVPREMPAGPGIPAAPHLVLVHGLLEGKRFSLATGGASSGARWRIGRGAGMEVCLHYDPFASTEHAAVVKEGPRFFLEDAGSKNGTFVDWERLPARTRVPLSPGGIIGVGRSLLCFRPA